jgi:hypothetical protein
MRWRIERDYQELKQELGLAHYEGRGWRGFHHHATLCIAAYGFLVRERSLFPPSRPLPWPSACVMAEREAKKPKLSGRVEVDDAYLGGERSGGKRGRGAAGKTPIVAAVETTLDRKPKRLKLTVVKGFRKKEVEKLAKRDMAPGTTVVSDGLSCWPAVAKAGCAHRPIVTGSGKRAAGWAPFRWVNTTLGNIKTAIAGTYHHLPDEARTIKQKPRFPGKLRRTAISPKPLILLVSTIAIMFLVIWWLEPGHDLWYCLINDDPLHCGHTE